eukprot:TRINITY_DN27043_c0_g1_i1.p1 TRINITY_DN27043_c0_g1~~TRINITY_DN27043_c0_g1_i1.p1  ORF type:complete len:132 (-),score=15.39 TRINITY_DN27043_c0_g1_i1:73-468(-)
MIQSLGTCTLKWVEYARFRCEVLRSTMSCSPATLYATKSAITMMAILISSRASACFSSSNAATGMLASPLYAFKYPSTSESYSTLFTTLTAADWFLTCSLATLGTPEVVSPPASTSMKLSLIHISEPTRPY